VIKFNFAIGSLLQSLMKKIVLLSLIINSILSVTHVSASEPTQQTLGIFATQGNCNEIELSFVPGNGSRRIVVGCANTNVFQFPDDFHGYTAGSLYGTGSDLGSGNYVVYAGSGTSVTVTGLTGGTEYFFAVFEYNGSGNNSNYLITGYPEASEIAQGISMSVSSSSGDMCAGDSVHLEAHGAATYQWSPASTLSSTTDSAVWARPVSSTTYNVMGSDANGCSDILSVSITVYSNPNVSLGNFNSRCINGGTVTLNNGNPSGGTYSGTGVSGNIFNPNVAGAGLHVITYSYSDIHGCSASDTSSIRVWSKPNASFPSLPDVCIDLAPFNYTTGSPSGGIYSGTGVSGGQLFNPSVAGVGHHTIKYIYTNSNGCADTSQADQQVRALPVVDFDQLDPLCINTNSYTLIEGSPAGGTYSGTGVNNGNFSPQVSGPGTFILTYTYSDSHGCSGNDTSAITVNTLPSVSLNPVSTVCANTGPVQLSGGSPAGGSYSGTAVSGTVFYTGIAGPGQHAITYSFTDSHGCTNSASQNITVNAIPSPSLGSDIIACGDASVFLTPGTFTAYTWSTGAHTSSINVDTIHRGLGTFQFIVTVSNANNCINRDTIMVTFDNCNGIQNVSADHLKIYPNPTADNFTVLSETNVDIEVYDMNGRQLIATYSNNGVFNFGDEFPSGSYILRLQKNHEQVYKLLIKQ
jgi:hypothetical protein